VPEKRLFSTKIFQPSEKKIIIMILPGMNALIFAQPLALLIFAHLITALFLHLCNYFLFHFF